MIPKRLHRPPVQQQEAIGEAPRLGDAGALRFARDAGPWQRSLNWRAPPRDLRLLLIGLLVAIALTVVELAGFGLGMRRQITEVTPPRKPQTIEVVLIEPPPALPEPPEPEPPPFVPKASKVRVAAPVVKLPPPPQAAEQDSDAMRARMGASGAPSAPRLFNPDGSIQLAAPIAPVKAPINPQEAARQRWAEIEKRGENPLDCKRTRFAQAFAPDESLGDKVSRKYLKWIGLGDGEAIAHRAQQKAERAAEGCDPPPK